MREYYITPEEALDGSGVTREGLSQQEASVRLRDKGRNVLEEALCEAIWQRIGSLEAGSIADLPLNKILN